MTLGEFRKQTANYPDNIDLFIDERLTEFRYGLVNSIEKIKIKMYSEEDNLNTPMDALVLCED